MIKKLQSLTVVLFLIVFSSIHGQNVTYDLRCSADNASYEVYVTRDTDPGTPLTNMASTRITLVLPTAATQTVSHTSEGGITYSALPSISNPGSNGNDYYGFSATGGPSLIGLLTANTPTLWMTFTPSNGTSQDARLFVNGTDPGPSDTGMGGVDLSNVFSVITIAGINDEYSGNVSNIVNCDGTLTTVEVDLNALTLYPNPANDKVYIKGNTSDLKALEIYSMNGQLVKRSSVDNGQNLKSIDVSRLESAVYFINLYSDQGQKVLRLVKE